eukprot:CAMPEP_0194527592 /NCGR_PEP_ID=MMETSP0253-20130528/63730_1 /TAXON_ID=2966 /ORGANISM="Noctiluca scintillans" /LENGTH=782 /DNA_ID=CAMNT_0039372553 /DNA_START=1 /DNA_END=2349 /DNA_ORIENTATION=-
MPLLVLLRSGESVGDVRNICTGWADVELSERGIAEAREAGRSLKEFKFDVVFTSLLRRSIHTAWLALEASENFAMPILNTWRLNEQHCGALQGLSHAETTAKYGEAQANAWRTGYAVLPPSMDTDDNQHPVNDVLYHDIPRRVLPGAESMELSSQRVLPFWYDCIGPAVQASECVLVCAHQTSLCAICKIVEDMSEEVTVEFPGGIPVVYELDQDLNFVRKYHLIEPGDMPKRLASMANQDRQNHWTLLFAHAEKVKSFHLRSLLADSSRNDSMFVEACECVLDFCRQKVTKETMALLLELAQKTGVVSKRDAMFRGDRINVTENRSVLHVALRMPRTASVSVNGKNVVPDVWTVLDSIKSFTDKVRSGEWRGHTGKALSDVVCIGIGGSYLGVDFVYEALRTDPHAAEQSRGRGLRFLANVDPIDVKRALEGLLPETTLVVIISKTFTTAETMLNAKTVKAWLVKSLGDDCVAKHVVACSTALDKTKAFGIDPANVFGFWDWVGGRFSLCSAVGVLPLSLHYGFNIVDEFLQGAHAMDEHFLSAPPEANIPILLGLLAVWNCTCLGHEACAVLPYCQALTRFVAHIQQLDMESNGKRVQMDGVTCLTSTGALYFGEPGTNGQHSFYQLLHQGRVVPAEFIGFKVSQNPVALGGEPVSNHDELMSNFFAQPDALALGKTEEQLREEGVPQRLVAHKVFLGDRPSLSLLLPVCDARTLGRLLALYEHRTAVQGWVWNVNSFDQWGVELGKVLAGDIRTYFVGTQSSKSCAVSHPTLRLLGEYQ